MDWRGGGSRGPGACSGPESKAAGRRRCVLSSECEVSAQLMGLRPRLARDAASYACSAAASSAWSGRRGCDQPDERSHLTAKTVRGSGWEAGGSDGEADEMSDRIAPALAPQG